MAASICPFSSGPCSGRREPFLISSEHDPQALLPKVFLFPPSQPGSLCPHRTREPEAHQSHRPGLLPAHFSVFSGAHGHSSLWLHPEHSLLSSDRGIFSFLKPISCQHWLLNILCPLVLWHLGDLLAQTFLPVITMKRWLPDGWVGGGRGSQGRERERRWGKKGRASAFLLSPLYPQAQRHLGKKSRALGVSARSLCRSACVMALE